MILLELHLLMVHYLLEFSLLLEIGLPQNFESFRVQISENLNIFFCWNLHRRKPVINLLKAGIILMHNIHVLLIGQGMGVDTVLGGKFAPELGVGVVSEVGNLGDDA